MIYKKFLTKRLHQRTDKKYTRPELEIKAEKER